MNDLNKTQEYAKEIRDWFASGRDFSEGYLLFVRFSHNRAMAMQLARKGATMQSKLEYELTKILERSLIIERPVLPIGQVQKVVAPVIKMKVDIATDASFTENVIEKQDKVLVRIEGKVDYESLTVEQKVWCDANRNLIKEMRSWHEKMKLAKTDDERSACRAQVVTIDDTIRDNWKLFDASFQPASDSGKPENQKKAADPVKDITNARSYLSKNLPKLEKLTGKKLNNMKAELKARYDLIILAGQAVDEKTIAKLTSCGIIVA